MAKDGTNRGGTRVGAGRKKKPLAQQLQEGDMAMAMPAPAELEGVKMPPVKEYLYDNQRIGELYGKEVFEDTWNWLNSQNCAHLISSQLLEQYSMAMGRYIQLERLISEIGFVTKHPTTQAPITNPFASIAQNYLRQANVIWQQIYQIVKENSLEPVKTNPQTDMMEKLLGM